MNWRIASRLLTLSLLLFLFNSCRDDEPMVTPTILEITIVDEDVLPVEGADVTLYSSLDNWLSESNPVRGLTSDTAGIVIFTDLDTGEYFIDIQKELLNNWESGAKKTVFANLVNSTRITVSETKSGLLSSAQGKKWNLKGYIRNDVDVYDFLEDCAKDSERTFFKGPTLGSAVISPGELICDSEGNAEEGIWQFSPDQNNIDITLPFDDFRWNIELLTEDSLRYSYIQRITGFPIEEIYIAE